MFYIIFHPDESSSSYSDSSISYVDSSDNWEPSESDCEESNSSDAKVHSCPTVAAPIVSQALTSTTITHPVTTPISHALTSTITTPDANANITAQVAAATTVLQAGIDIYG